MKKTVCILLVLAILGGLTACVPSERTESVSDSVGTAGGGEGIFRILLLGCDRSAALCDSILLFTVSERTKSTSVLQIPRDTYAEYTTKSYKKLNGAANELGLDGMQRLLEEVLGVDIDAYVAIKPDALVTVVDAIGGVDVTVPQDMDYSDPAQGLEIHLEAGEAHLDGKAAEQFVRYRSGYANADLGRLDAQKIFLQSFATRCKSLSLSQTIGILTRVMTKVQTNLTLPAAIRLLRTLRECDERSIPMATLPGIAVRGDSGAWYYVVNREGAVRAINAYLLPQTPKTVDDFDPQGILDREINERFHKIYEASEDRLPLLADGIY